MLICFLMLVVIVVCMMVGMEIMIVVMTVL